MVAGQPSETGEKWIEITEEQYKQISMLLEETGPVLPVVTAPRMKYAMVLVYYKEQLVMKGECKNGACKCYANSEVLTWW